MKELIAAVERLIVSRELKRAFGNALLFELQVVLKKIQGEKTRIACRLLDVFTHQVKILVKTHRLSSPSGQALVDKAQEVRLCQPGT